MTICFCGILNVILVFVILALVFKNNKRNPQPKSYVQSELSGNNVQSGDKSNHGEKIRLFNNGKHLSTPIKIGLEFVLELTLSLPVTITSVVIVTNPDISSMEKCTVLICLILLTGVIILSTTLYKIHSEKIALERDLSNETYSRNLERETLKYPNKDIIKSETDSSESDNLEGSSENKQ